MRSTIPIIPKLPARRHFHATLVITRVFAFFQHSKTFLIVVVVLVLIIPRIDIVTLDHIRLLEQTARLLAQKHVRKLDAIINLLIRDQQVSIRRIQTLIHKNNELIDVSLFQSEFSVALFGEQDYFINPLEILGQNVDFCLAVVAMINAESLCLVFIARDSVHSVELVQLILIFNTVVHFSSHVTIHYKPCFRRRTSGPHLEINSAV